MTNLVNDTTQRLNTSWEVEAPDPVSWPGENFEMLSDTSGFIEPDCASKILSENQNDNLPWTKKKDVDPYVENIYTIEKQDSPWRIRTRLAGDGVHADAEFVQYVLELKCVVGTKERGSYHEMEVARGSLSEVTLALSKKLPPVIEARIPSCAKFEKDYRVVLSREELAETEEQMALSKVR